MTHTPLHDRAAEFFVALQSGIVAAIEALDGQGRFVVDDWQREPSPEGPILGGSGRTRVMADGAVFERAGCNFSLVHGRFSEDFARTMPGDGLEFTACGVSLVFHPRNPHVPTVHANYRHLSRGSTGWFGGGADLTPYVLDVDDARHFHAVHRAACDAHPAVADYARFKRDCDQYFFLKHRHEARGIGGIFFDHLIEQPEAAFAFVQSAGRAFVDAYLPIVAKHRDEPYTAAQRDWQLHRRGRYVEFNLLWDRGTVFGLRTGGRIESILMSLPPEVRWSYDHQPLPDSPEAALLAVLQSPRDWLDEGA